VRDHWNGMLATAAAYVMENNRKSFLKNSKGKKKKHQAD